MKFWNKRKYITGRAIIIQDDKLLVFHRKRRNKAGKWVQYYSIPGGELNKNEEPEQAAVRELQEEMGVEIALKGLVAHFKGKIFEHYVFHADIIAGTPRFMSDSQEAQDYMNENNQYAVVWVPVDQLTKENLKFYGIFYEHIVALAAGKSVEDVKQLKF